MGKRRIMHSFRLDKIAAVDFPCQEHATMAIAKRAHALTGSAIEILKFCEGEDGAKSFSELFADREKRDRYWEAREELWPAMDSVSSSINSIIADMNISTDQKAGMIRQSVEDFLAVVREKMPEVEAEIAKALGDCADEGKTGSETMTELETAKARIAELEKANGELTTEVTTLKGQVETVTAEVTKSKGELADIAKRASDETLTVGETTVAKSAVGEATFAILKAQQAELTKAQETAAMVGFEKRADDELGSLIGTTKAKASILKAMAGMPDDARAALDTILKAANATFEKAMDRFGATGENKVDITKASTDFNGKVSEIAKRDNCGRAMAMSKAKAENPELFAAAYPDQAA